VQKKENASAAERVIVFKELPELWEKKRQGWNDHSASVTGKKLKVGDRHLRAGLQQRPRKIRKLLSYTNHPECGALVAHQIDYRIGQRASTYLQCVQMSAGPHQDEHALILNLQAGA
jgi:hypothetical protein